jgi:hypothetical protein
MTATAPLIEDFLASFCFAGEGDPAAEIGQLSALAEDLNRRFRYWEIVYVLSERFRGDASDFPRVLARTKNLRIIIVADNINFYRRRTLAVSEAIGDVVVLTSFAEAGAVDPPACAEQAYLTGEILLCCRKARWTPALSLHWLLTALTSHRVNPQDLRTIALPRGRLNGMLPRPTLTLDLRFEPKRGADRYRRKLVATDPWPRRAVLSDRLELLEQLILTSAPRLLRIYAAVSASVTFLSFLYALYAVAVLLFKADVQKGWFSTAIVQSGSVGFIAIGMTVIAIGLAGIAERLSGRSRNDILDEIANISFFDRTKSANVEQARVQDSEIIGAE